MPIFPDQASTMAPRVDALYFILLGVSGFFTLLIATLLIVFAVKYRRRSESERPAAVHASVGLEIFWSVVPFLITLGFFYGGARVYFDMHQPPPDTREILVVGKQWMWHLQHLEGQREINELHVPVGRPIKLTLTSQDVIHDFSIPAFRVKQDVIPGRYTTLWFEATKVGKYHLFCGEYCGTNHSRMVGWIEVMEPSRFQTWLTSGSDTSPATRGRQLFLKLQCVACHNRESQAHGPLLEDLAGNVVPLQDGRTVRADDGYLRESILRPEAKIVAGFQPIMPSFEGQLDETEIFELLAFIKSLKAGQMPLRNEDTAPPTSGAEAAASTRETREADAGVSKKKKR